MRYLLTFTSGILVGLSAGLLLDKDNRKKIQDIAKAQADKMRDYEQTLKTSIDKIKNIVDNKKKTILSK